MAAPTTADVEAFLEAGGITLSAAAQAQLSPCLESALDEWERRTGWVPFIAATQTRKYDTDGSSSLVLDNAIVSDYTVTLDTTQLVEGTHYELRPYNHSRKREIYFYSAPSAGIRRVEVQAKFGYSADWPDDAKQAVIVRAAALMIENQQASKAFASGGAVSEVAVADVKVVYGDYGSESAIYGWMNLFDQTVMRYRRARC